MFNFLEKASWLLFSLSIIFCLPACTAGSFSNFWNKAESKKGITFSGSMKSKKETFSKNLTVNGGADLSKITIEKSLKVNGCLDAQELIVKGTCTVNGSSDIEIGDFNQKLELHGGATLTDVKADEIFASGSLEGTRLKVAKNLKVSGAADCKNSEVGGDAIFSGGAHLFNCTFKGSTELSGGTTIEKSTFKDTKISTSRSVVLKDSSINGVLELESDSKKLVVTLDNTTVQGDITFDFSKAGSIGEVILSGSSSVKGAVKGGKVVKK